MTTVNVDFTDVDKVPQGALLLEITKVEAKTSQNGNPMLAVQMKVMSGEDDEFNGRIVFDSWMLATQAVFRTKQALQAFQGKSVKGPTEIDVDDLVGQQAWCDIIVEPGDESKGYQDRSRVKRYGVKAS